MIATTLNKVANSEGLTGAFAYAFPMIFFVLVGVVLSWVTGFQALPFICQTIGVLGAFGLVFAAIPYKK